MRVAKPDPDLIKRKQKEEQQRQEIERVKAKLKGKKQLSQTDIQDLVILLAKQHGLITD